MFFIAWFKYTLHTENVYTNIINQRSASFLTNVKIHGTYQSLYKYKVLPPEWAQSRGRWGMQRQTCWHTSWWNVLWSHIQLAFCQMQHIKCMKTSTKIEKLYKCIASWMWSATLRVRPIWWEGRLGYVQHTHQAHTQTGMLKPSGHRVDVINKKETVLIIVHILFPFSHNCKLYIS